MRCKIFSVPVESGDTIERERQLNNFLGATNVKRIFASLSDQPKGPLWSVLFIYDEAAEAPRQFPSRPEAAVSVSAAVTPPATQNASSRPADTAEADVPLTRQEVKSIVALKKWRADAAALEGVPLYVVAQNRWLEEIVRMPVRTLDDLKKIRGLGEWRVQKYGARIVETLNSVSMAKGSWQGSSSYSAGRA